MKNNLKLVLAKVLMVFQVTSFCSNVSAQTCEELFLLQKEEVNSVSIEGSGILKMPEGVLQKIGQFFTNRWLIDRERPSDTIIYTGTAYTLGARIAGRSSGDHDLVFVTDINLALPTNLPASLRKIFHSNVNAWEIIHYDFEPSIMRVGFGISHSASNLIMRGHWNAKIHINLSKVKIMPEKSNDLYYVIADNRARFSYVNEKMDSFYEMPIRYFQRFIEDLYKMGYTIENFKQQPFNQQPVTVGKSTRNNFASREEVVQALGYDPTGESSYGGKQAGWHPKHPLLMEDKSTDHYYLIVDPRIFSAWVRPLEKHKILVDAINNSLIPQLTESGVYLVSYASERIFGGIIEFKIAIFKTKEDADKFVQNRNFRSFQ